MEQEKYILYGASFNPPHIGHFSAITQMLEEYDKVLVFPYPKKHIGNKFEILPPISQRMRMLEIFFMDFFPKISDRLILINLSGEMKIKKDEVIHTYDYLKYVQNKIPKNAQLSACLGFDTQFLLRKENFHNHDLIKEEFHAFYLQEENKIKSEDLRAFFSNHKNLKSKKDEEYIRYAVGNSLAEYIFKNNLYGIKKKTEKPEYKIGDLSFAKTDPVKPKQKI